MNVLHAAALPYPSHQGTQAALTAMLETLTAHRGPAHLLAHAHGASAPSASFTVHRLPDFPRVRSLESGPSWGRLALDLQMVRALRNMQKRLRPDVIVAHHVEAATAAILARVPRFVFFAHTALGPELPTYLSSRWASLAARAGERVDDLLVRHADAVAAISPLLRDRLARRSGRSVHYVPLPWALPEERTEAERSEARRILGLGHRERVVLYPGNLDAYQGWEVLVGAIARLASSRSDVRLLVATHADVRSLLARAERDGLRSRIQVTSLKGEPQRRLVHAAADVVAVPRRAEGGLPIKLLDALARGVPVVASRRATAGLSLGDAALVTGEDDVELAAGIESALATPESAARLGARGRRFVASEHGVARFLSAFDDLLAATIFG